jgi:hypothetical protein
MRSVRAIAARLAQTATTFHSLEPEPALAVSWISRLRIASLAFRLRRRGSQG